MASDDDPLLKTEEVARLFRVVPKTIGEWVKSGHLKVIRTPGGQRRFRQSEIFKLLEGSDGG